MPFLSYEHQALDDGVRDINGVHAETGDAIAVYQRMNFDGVDIYNAADFYAHLESAQHNIRTQTNALDQLAAEGAAYNTSNNEARNTVAENAKLLTKSSA